MDALADEIAKLRAHVVNLQKTYEGTGPLVQKFYRQSHRTQLDDRDKERIHSNPPPPRRTRNQNVICHRCKEPGHYASECRSEIPGPAIPQEQQRGPRHGQANAVKMRVAGYLSASSISSFSDTDSDQPSRSSKKVLRHRNYITDPEDSDNEKEPIYAYPVTRRGMEKSATKPYTRTSRRNKAQEPPRPKENRSKRQAMEQDIPLTEEPPFADSLTEENTLTNRGKKGSRQYQYDPWNKIKALNAGITIEELVEIAPAVRPFLQNNI